MRYLLTIELATGERHEFAVARLPRHWTSWLMHQMPYGTTLRGCRFFRQVLEVVDA